VTFGARIAGMGMDVPTRVVTNKDLESVVDTTDEWIVTRTGIRERRIVADDQSTGDLAVQACRDALRSAGISIDDIEMIVLSTCTGDTNMLPATATYVQTELGASHIPAFDISAACSGFVYGLDIAHQFIATGRCRRILVVGAEAMSRVVDWSDRASCVLFGDGAGAAVLERCPPGQGILGTKIASNGAGACLLQVPAGGAREPLTADTVGTKRQFLHMDGKAVYSFAVEIMGEAAMAALEAAGISPSDIDLLVPHQANIRIIKSAADRMGLPLEKVFINVDRYGNTSAASIPIALTEAVRSGRLKEGDLVVTVGFGAGLTWGANVMRWGQVNP
jgi:3-oxoacyl-[acyl-carrier-protein] synthase-3